MTTAVGFGENWRHFLEVLDDERIAEAERSLTEWLGEGSLEGKSFLDAGCGSGLFSLAALRLGARRVHSFDYDPDSVGCALELRRRFGGEDDTWTVDRGDVLDDGYVGGLGSYDVVSTPGAFCTTRETCGARSARSSTPSRRAAGCSSRSTTTSESSAATGRLVKRIFNRLPVAVRVPYAVALVMAPRELASLAVQTLRGRPQDYVHSWTRYKATRGMSRWHDLLDWDRGLPVRSR